MANQSGERPDHPLVLVEKNHLGTLRMKKSPGYKADAYSHGLLCQVYRGAQGNDCTLNGVTSKHNAVLLVGPDVDGPFKVIGSIDGNTPVLYLHSWTSTEKGKEVISYYASPDSENGMRYCFGGNFIYTSDSRFPSNSAIKVHDRCE